MEMNSFIQVYFEDKKNELKENSIRNKQHMMNKHIVPYFGREGSEEHNAQIKKNKAKYRGMEL